MDNALFQQKGLCFYSQIHLRSFNLSDEGIIAYYLRRTFQQMIQGTYEETGRTLRHFWKQARIAWVTYQKHETESVKVVSIVFEKN